MKYSTLCLLLFILLLPAACDIESTDNGNLDGFWHLEQVDTLATGGSLNLKEQKIFWGRLSSSIAALPDNKATAMSH